MLVLSNPNPDTHSKQKMVGKVCQIINDCGYWYDVFDENNSCSWAFPSWCIVPAFDEDSLSGKEAKVVIDGKEYSVTLKLI